MKNSKSDFIKYLYNEGVRAGVHKDPNFYTEIIKFTNTPQGQQSFNQFLQINPERLGIATKAISNNFKRTF